MSQPNEKPTMADEEEDEEFNKLLAGFEATATAVARDKEYRVNSLKEALESEPISADLAAVRGHRRELLAGRVKPPEAEYLCSQSGKTKYLYN